MRALRSVPLLLLAACSTPGLRTGPSQDPSRIAPPGLEGLRLVREPQDNAASPELNAALRDFSDRARGCRERVGRGGAMPAVEAKGWGALAAWLDGFLARPVREHDLSRARAALEEELELDSRAYGELPPEVVQAALDRISLLDLRLAEVRRARERAASSRRKALLAWPLAPVSVTSPFGTRLHPFTGVYQLHQGADLAAFRGQRVGAAGDGTVTYAGYGKGYGRYVEVDHGGGVMTRYGHLSAILVEAGAAVKQGEALGLAGSSGVSTGVHLHFELWRGGQAVDPLVELGSPEKAVPVAHR